MVLLSLSGQQLFLLSRQVLHSSFRGIQQALILHFTCSRWLTTFLLTYFLVRTILNFQRMAAVGSNSTSGKPTADFLMQSGWHHLYYWCWYRSPCLADNSQVSNNLLLNTRLWWQRCYLCAISCKAILPQSCCGKKFHNKVVSVPSQTENGNHIHYLSGTGLSLSLWCHP